METTPVASVAPPDDRRVALAPVAERDVLDFFSLGLAAELPTYVCLPRIAGLPEGARVRHVYHDFYRRTFEFVVQHASFDAVPDGHLLPRVDDGVRQVEAVRIKAIPPADLRLAAEAVADGISDWEEEALEVAFRDRTDAAWRDTIVARVEACLRRHLG